MARTYKTKTIAVPLELYKALEQKKAEEHRYGSFNSYVCGVLDQHVRDEIPVFTTPEIPEESDKKDVHATRVRRVTENEQRKSA